MRRIYAARRQLLLDGLHKDFSRWLEPIPCAAGLHLAALARSSADVDAMAQRARERDIGIYSLRPYQLGKRGRPGLVFGYGAIDEHAIAEGLSRLRRLWKA
jgi:GntR family transcriptional regulator/MocR family aminotransferase